VEREGGVVMIGLLWGYKFGGVWLKRRGGGGRGGERARKRARKRARARAHARASRRESEIKRVRERDRETESACGRERE